MGFVDSCDRINTSTAARPKKQRIQQQLKLVIDRHAKSITLIPRPVNFFSYLDAPRKVNSAM
jgi:hypothetical protein